MVDLAGSERTYKTAENFGNATGPAATSEARSINKSLSYLEQVIVALGERRLGRMHVPFRNSLLTSVLRDSLGGNCMTVMIATMSAEFTNLEETLSTARFANRCQKLINEVNVNEQMDLNSIVRRLQEQNMALSKRLRQQDYMIRY